jgi:4-hydroxybenzoyl-CoA thioesterase
MAFRTRIPIRFGDEDHAGIVYYPRFFEFFHCAFEDFFNASGHPYRQVLDETHTGWPTVHLESDFMKPLRFGDTLVVDVWVERLGTRSAVFAYHGRREGSDELAVSCRVTVACIDMKTFRAKPIPDVYRALFEGNTDPPSD